MTKIVYCGTIQDQIVELDVDFSSMSLDELIEFNKKHGVITISVRKLAKYTREDFIYKFNQKLEMFKQTLRQGY